MKVVVILPACNEKEDVLLLLRSLLGQFSKISHDMHILIVDDNSSVGVADAVRAEFRTASNIFLITGRGKGLGAAYILGMKYAITDLHADAVIEMDADISQKPDDVPRLIGALDQGDDFVIGSGCVPGGKLPEDWGFLRKMNYKWGNVFVRYLAGIYKVRDCTAGFRAIRSPLIRKMDLDALKGDGYSFQLSLLHEAIVNDAVVREIPVEFVDRRRGQKKPGFSDMVGFMLNAWRIRFDRSKTFLKFSVVGATGVVVNLASFTILMAFGLSKFIASPLAIELSIISNFVFNNFWTFSDRGGNGRIHSRAVKFHIISVVALVVSYSTFLLLSMIDPAGIPQIHQAVGIVPAALINYFLNAYWTFKDDGHPRSRAR
ncbi:MAG TPA: GtrA family protein [Nitrospirota bacterium]|nr:GtrA family protein [Nitrospirota bacterium]